MVLGYIPDLGYGNGKAKRQTAEMKLQDEHKISPLITNQIIKIHEEGGFWTEVMRRCVFMKLWIHFIAGDTSGHNGLNSSIETADVSLMISLVPYQCVLSSHQRN